jgi:hypothetical protein
MQIIFDDRNENRSGDSFRLILLKSGWHVVAKGYLCRVTDQEEGRRVIGGFKRRKSSAELLSQTDVC